MEAADGERIDQVEGVVCCGVRAFGFSSWSGPLPPTSLRFSNVNGVAAEVARGGVRWEEGMEEPTGAGSHTVRGGSWRFCFSEEEEEEEESWEWGPHGPAGATESSSRRGFRPRGRYRTDTQEGLAAGRTHVVGAASRPGADGSEGLSWREGTWAWACAGTLRAPMGMGGQGAEGSCVHMGGRVTGALTSDL